MPTKKFIRRDSNRYSKIGKNRKKLQKWRRARGRDNKIREGRFGYPKAPTVGHKTARATAGTVKGLRPYRVSNVSDLEKAPKNAGIVVASVGARKKLAIIKQALAMKFAILNVRREGTKNAA